MRCLLNWTGCLLILMAGGCAICANPYDSHYAAYGGLRQRTDMVRGRVGSVFDPASEVSREARSEQSPQPVPADARGAAPALTEPAPLVPDSLAIPGADSETFPGTPDQPPTGSQPKLPQVPEGTIELPELEPNGATEPDTLPSPSQLPPDLPGQNDRSAWRHPLRDMFEPAAPNLDRSSP